MKDYGHGLLSHFILVLYVLYLYEAQISGERLQDHWSSGLLCLMTRDRNLCLWFPSRWDSKWSRQPTIRLYCWLARVLEFRI